MNCITERIWDDIESTDVDEIHLLIKSYIKEGMSVTDIFNGAAAWYSNLKVGHVDDKIVEVFNELSGILYSVNIENNSALTLYRGCSDRDLLFSGFSWTTNKEVAIWFANRYCTEKYCYLATMKISSNDTLGFVSGIECEVVVHFDNVDSDKVSVNKMLSRKLPDIKSYLKETL